MSKICLICVDYCCAKDQEDTELVDDALVDGGDGGLVLEQDPADQVASQQGQEEDEKHSNIFIQHYKI